MSYLLDHRQHTSQSCSLSLSIQAQSLFLSSVTTARMHACHCNGPNTTDLYLSSFDGKVQRFCWSKGTLFKCTELVYVKTTETVCVSGTSYAEEEEEEDGQIVNLDNSYIERVHGSLAILSMLTVRAVVLEYSQVYKKGIVVCFSLYRCYSGFQVISDHSDRGGWYCTCVCGDHQT